MVLKIVADFPGEREERSFLPPPLYTNLCGLITKSNKRGQIVLALTGQSGFPTTKLYCANTQQNNTAAKEFLPELLPY